MPGLTNTPTMIPMEDLADGPTHVRTDLNGEPVITVEDHAFRGSTVSIDEPPRPRRRGERPFDCNQYATRKTIATSLLDLALLSANACQMKICLQLGPEKQEFFHLLMVLISTSIAMQAAAAILFLLVARGNVGDSTTQEGKNNQKRTALLNDVATGLVFIITVVNVFITSFGMTEKIGAETTTPKVFSNSEKVTTAGPSFGKS